jgi:threonine dehydratase
MNNITLQEYQSAYEKIKPYIKNTKLENFKNNIYLKKESNQISGSFKWSGVLHSIIVIFDNLIIHKKSPFHIVTQSTGNHGIATLKAINMMIEIYKKKYPKLKYLFDNIIAGIFTNKLILKNKLDKMYIELNKFKNNKVFIKKEFENYEESLKARIDFLKNNEGVYVEHGGKNILLGYGALAFQINNQLEKNKTMSFITTVGAGGPVGIALCLSYLRNTNFYIVQPETYDSFIRSINSNEIKYNKNNNIIVSDGIAVDKPEEFALNIAKKIVSKCFTVKIKDVLKIKNLTNLGNSSCIALSGINLIDYKKTDYVIVLDCEGNS